MGNAPEQQVGALPLLVEALKDESGAVQEAAVETIGKLLKSTPSLAAQVMPNVVEVLNG